MNVINFGSELDSIPVPTDPRRRLGATMSTDNAGDGLRKAVEALAGQSASLAAEHFHKGNPTRAGAHAGTATALRRILAEHPATPAEVAPKQCRRCGVTYRGANAGVLCEPPYASSHDFPPAEPDAGDVALTEAERVALVEAVGNRCGHTGKPDYSLPNWCRECDQGVREDLAPAVERIVAAREREAAERAGERIAQAIETRTIPTATTNYNEGWEDAIARAARIARAEASP